MLRRMLFPVAFASGILWLVAYTLQSPKRWCASCSLIFLRCVMFNLRPCMGHFDGYGECTPMVCAS